MPVRSAFPRSRPYPYLRVSALLILAICAILAEVRSLAPRTGNGATQVGIGDLLRWHGRDGRERLLVPAAGGHRLVVYDARSGRPLRHLDKGQTPFDGISALARSDRLVFVAERDAHRVQILALPALTPVARVNLGDRAWPTDLSVKRLSADHYRIDVSVLRQDGDGTRRLHVDWQQAALATR